MRHLFGSSQTFHSEDIHKVVIEHLDPTEMFLVLEENDYWSLSCSKPKALSIQDLYIGPGT